MDDLLKKPSAFSLDIIGYAGTPSDIPLEEKSLNWGSLNKQLAFSNLSEADVSDIEDLVRIRELKQMSCLRDNELRDRDISGADQAAIVSKCLSSLGKHGFLIKRATTNSHEISNKNTTENSKSRFFGIGANKEPQQPQAVDYR
ncbi:MAG: hypothetical protein QM426_10505 [Euryarchaeota archaeon]|nr:hypothetical protein [Euryarchaeota archaeon]